jgi:hypothetical protein
MLWLGIGLAALLGVLTLLHVFAHSSPAAIKRAAVWGLGSLGAVFLGVMLLSGRGANALWALIMFGPALMQAFRAWRAKQVFSRPAPEGEASGVETATLSMRLDLGSGAMSGQVRRGPFAGRDLAGMSRAELLELLADCAANDPESAPLLEAWLDRTDPLWREEPPPARPAAGPMTRAEALAVLGLQEGASEAEIRAAHRRLMQSAHPDRGGSDWLAARVNEAREVLLGARRA